MKKTSNMTSAQVKEFLTELGQPDDIVEKAIKTGEIAALLMERLGSSDAEIQNIGIIASLMNCGMPIDVLKVPLNTKLTDEQFKRIIMHPENGWELMRRFGFGDCYAEAILVAYCHHVWFHAGGYPEYQELSLTVEVWAAGVAESIAAMKYGKKLSNEALLGELERCKGTQFSHRAAEAAIALIKEGRI